MNRFLLIGCVVLLEILTHIAQAQRIIDPYRFGSAGANLNNSLVAYWNMEEASGDRFDCWTNAITLLDNNTVTQSVGPGTNGFAAQFTSANSEFFNQSTTTFSMLRTGEPPGFAYNTQMTFTLWVYMDTISVNHALVDIFPDSVQRNYRIDMGSGNNIRFTVSSTGNNAGSVDSTVILSASTWYFIACGHDPDTDQLWISINDGTVETAAWSAGVYSQTGTPFRVGRSSSTGDFYMNGRIARLGFWKRHLTAAEITYLKNGTIGRRCPFN